VIAALLARLGLPLLIEAVAGGLSKLDHPSAKAAGDALGQVSSAIAEGGIAPERLAEANRHLESLAALDSRDLAEINATIRAEVQGEDKFARRWRPFFGYVVACSWAICMAAAGYSIVVRPQEAPSILSALAELSAMWGIALAILGVAVVKRSDDKRIAAGLSEPAPILSRLLGR